MVDRRALVLLVGAVLIGGLRRISDVAGKLVPFMTVAYFGAGVIVLGIYFTEILRHFLWLLPRLLTLLLHKVGLRGCCMGCNTLWGCTRRIFQ